MELDPIDQRVLGSLLEKERTVPATYPLTLNALRSACNQTSGRDPIVDLGDVDVSASIDRLKSLGLARIVHAGAGSRATKYRQVLDEKLELANAERAVITLLLLRGAQTPGELRSRSDRLYEFHSLEAVDAALASLAAREEPLVEEQERRPGQKERRWVHLLGPSAASTSAPATAPAAPTPAPLPVVQWIDDPEDGWLLVRVRADQVDPAITALAATLGPGSDLRVGSRQAEEALDVFDRDTDRVYVLDRAPAPPPESPERDDAGPE